MKVQIIVGSVREGRVSDRVAQWVDHELHDLGVESEVLDLRDYELPFFEEAIPPQYNPDRQPSAAVKKWIDKVAEADAYVIVTPEYNRSFPGVLKNALDTVGLEFEKKPVALVAHGSSGGAQAVGHLRGTVSGMRAVTTPTATYISTRASELLDESGKLLDEAIKENPWGPHAALVGTLSELKWYAEALNAARS